MSGHHFTFPPPPPPPAPSQASQSYPGASQPFVGPNGHRGRGNRGGAGNRGRGYGHNQGDPRAGYFGSLHSTSSYGNFSLGVDNKRSPPPNMGYNSQTNDHRRSGYPLPNYPPVQLPQYPINLHQGYEQQKSAFPANARPPQAAYPANGSGSAPMHNGQQQNVSHGYSPSLSAIQPPLPAAQNNNSFQTNAHAGQPVLMGPPIRIGFDAQRSGHQVQHYAQLTANGTNASQPGLSNGNDLSCRHSSPIGFHSGRHEFPNPFPGHRGRGLGRGHGEAFNRPRNQNHRTQVAPAVPSFGSPLPLPIKPPALHENTKKPRKKKRKHNQLGLTPKAEEHESSEEEDDADEEARLAAMAASADQGPQFLQFNFKGRTSTLQSSSDIRAWIEERKKKFPTKARAAEIAQCKRRREEQQRAANQARREAQERHRIEVRERQQQNTEGEKQPKKSEHASEDAAARSRRKVEKLRRQLEKEEKRIAKAEAKATKGNENKKRKRSDSGGSGDAKVDDTKPVKPKLQEAANIPPDPLTPTSQPALADEERHPPPEALNAEGTPGPLDPSTGQEGGGPSFPDMDRSIQDSIVPSCDSSSDSFSADSEDITSSSGSSSDRDSHNEAPDETSTKRQGPEKVAPPKRAKPKQICREFLHKGLCKRGNRCKYLHELPERGSHGVGSKEVKRAEGRKERIGLYQRLVEQEKEQEDHEIVEAILHLGGKGLLEKGVQTVNGEGEVS